MDVLRIPTDEVKRGPLVMRSTMDQEALQQLAESLREHGMLQPIVVRRVADGYELIAGSRRLAAAKSLGWTEVPAVVLEADFQQAIVMQAVENAQREEVNPVEEAEYLADLKESLDCSAAKLARLLCKAESWVKERLQLLECQPELIEAVREGVIPLRAVRYLKRVTDPLTLANFIAYARHGGINVETARRWVEDYERQQQLREEIERNLANHPPMEPIPPWTLTEEHEATFTCTVCDTQKPVRELVSIACCRACYDALLETKAQQ